VACTELDTHYLLDDRSMRTFAVSALAELSESGSVIVRDRYQNYDCAQLGPLVQQLCCAHLLRDIDAATQVYSDARCLPTGCWSGCPPPPRPAPALVNTRPGVLLEPCATATATSCASLTTSRCPPRRTRPNAIYGPAMSNRTSPAS